jgi:putative NIF3 family GTP cyclohydrolase 1 type 2
MKASELIKELIADRLSNWGDTVDTLKAGDPNSEIHRVATCLTATTDVIRAAAKWGADLIITHEPTYFDHQDNRGDDVITKKKYELLTETGITVYRLHDSMHFGGVDAIADGFLRCVKWDCDFDGSLHAVLHTPMTPLEIAEDIQNKTGLRHVRIIGAREGKVTKIGLFLGHRGNDVWMPFRSDDEELAIGGEFCEWHDGEAIRDAAMLGMQKTILLLGHAGSERDGMKALADDISAAHSDLEVQYFEGGELYTYTD